MCACVHVCVNFDISRLKSRIKYDAEKKNSTQKLGTLSYFFLDFFCLCG